MVPEAGVLIDSRYVLDRLLDQGGMGSVWVARQVKDEHLVALKFLNHPLSSRGSLRRFRREARALQQLKAPHIVQLIGHGVDEGPPYIAMELLQGESLRANLTRNKVLAPVAALEILRQAAAGLGAAHAIGIVHRDVKPSNLFLCEAAEEQSVKVIDFGIATGVILEGDSQSLGTGLIGSPPYMSPEQARAESVTPQADVWSLAVVAFEMLTGREPFAGANVPDTLQRICSGKAPKASEVAAGLPRALDSVFEKAFARRPEARFADVFQLLAALDEAYRGVPNHPATPLSAESPLARTTKTTSFAASMGLARLGGSLPRGARLLGAAALALLTGGSLLVARASKEQPSKNHAAISAPSTLVSSPPAASKLPDGLRDASAPHPAEKAAVFQVAPSASPRSRQAWRREASAPANAASSNATIEPRRMDLDPTFGLPVDRFNASPRTVANSAGGGGGGSQLAGTTSSR